MSHLINLPPAPRVATRGGYTETGVGVGSLARNVALTGVNIRIQSQEPLRSNHYLPSKLIPKILNPLPWSLDTYMLLCPLTM